MEEKLYGKLLEEARTFCMRLPIDYREFLHSIISEEYINFENFKKLFVKRRWKLYKEIKEKPKYYIHPTAYSIITPNYLTDYKHCSHCDQILPEWEFYEGNKLCKDGYNEGNNIARREGRVREKRTDRDLKKSQKRVRVEIRNSYIIDLLQKNGCKKENITEEMIKQKRLSLYEKRKAKGKI